MAPSILGRGLVEIEERFLASFGMTGRRLALNLTRHVTSHRLNATIRNRR
jgi:hypothetical protein